MRLPRIPGMRASAPFSLHSNFSVSQNKRGQTTLEYLLLVAVAFITTYLVTTGPVSAFAADILGRIRGAIVNVVQNGDLAPGQVVQPATPGHPGDPSRIQRLH